MSDGLNYNSVLALSAPESGRTSMLVTSSSSNDTKLSRRDKIQFDIPASAFLNPASSYLKLLYKPVIRTASTVPVAPASGNRNTHVVLDGGVSSLISRMVLYHSSGGAEISAVENFDYVAQSLIKRKGKNFVDSVATNAMGYSPYMEWDTASSLASDNPYINGVKTGSILSYKFENGAVATATANTTYEGSFTQLCIPLALISGLFDTFNKVPLSLMSQSTVFRLEMTLNNAARAMCVVQYNDNGSALGANAFTNTHIASLDAEINNPELVLNISNVGQDNTELVRKAINTTGLHIKYDNVQSNVDTWVGTQESFTYKISKSLISLNQVIVQMRDLSKENDYFYPTVTTTLRFGLKSLQVQNGAKHVPLTPMEFDYAYSGEVFLNNYLACENKLKSVSGEADSFTTSGYQVATRGGFEAAINFNSEMDKDMPIFTGADTRSGSSSVQVYLKHNTAGSPANIQLCVIFVASAHLIVSKQGVIPPLLG